MQMSRNDFEKALRISFLQQFYEIPHKESEIDYEFSEGFEERMNKLISKQKKLSWKIINTAPKRLAVLVALIALLIAGTMSVSAIREPVMKFVMEMFDTHIDLSVEGQTTSVIAEEYELTWIPEGFELVDKSVSEVNVITTYRNNNGNEIQLWQTITQGINPSLDNEQAEVRVVSVNGKELILHMGERSSLVTWLESGYMFDVIYQGYVDEETMLKIVNSLELIEK